MPLQNRVDPFGAIHAVAARGMFTGNRGVIHDPDTRRLLARRWTTKAWIICSCTYKGQRRQVMGRNAPSGNAGWTALFFLDEVTALAAGHRPCFTCRHDAATAYAERFGGADSTIRPKAAEIDALLHSERLASGGKPESLAQADLRTLPDATVVACGDRAWAIRDGVARAWSFAGYDEAVDLASIANLAPLLVTPPRTVAVLRAGYRPAWHASAPGSS